MKYRMLLIFWVSVSFLLAGCEKKSEVKVSKTSDTNIQNQGGNNLNIQDQGTAIKGNMHSGIIRTTMNSAGYTYMEVEENGEKMWVAIPQTEAKVGDKVSFPDGTWMNQFQSKSLNRTFEKILFLGSVNFGSTATGSTTAAMSSQPQSQYQQGQQLSIPKPERIDPPKPGTIEKVEGGFTVEELYSQKVDLNGKKVKVRGKVVKVSSGIMGRNWIHIQDGTGTEGSNDITFTSEKETAELGSVILAEGIFAADKDFGAGYLYPAIVENSTFTK